MGRLSWDWCGVHATRGEPVTELWTGSVWEVCLCRSGHKRVSRTNPHHATGGAARPSLLFTPPGNGFSTLDARWKLLIGQHTSGIVRGDTVGLIGAPAAPSLL